MLFSLHKSLRFQEHLLCCPCLKASHSPSAFGRGYFWSLPYFPNEVIGVDGSTSFIWHRFYTRCCFFFVFVFCYITIPFIQTWDQHLDYHMPPEPGFVSAPGIGTIQTTTLWGHLFSIDSHVKIPHFTSIKKGLQPRTKYIWPLWIFSSFKPTKQGVFFHILQ